ncbi:MAG: GntR family transcriptional regulator, partial [Oceanococcaceae bacterium]
MKYKAYAEDVARLIRAGTLAPGQGLPSVRDVGAQRGLSPVTVLKAYHRLEAQGLIEARPRSGFYVVQSLPRPAPLPKGRGSSARALPVHKADFIHEVLHASKTPELVPLGSAFPSPTLFPIARLGRSMS